MFGSNFSEYHMSIIFELNLYKCCPISGIFFVVYIDDLIRILRKSGLCLSDERTTLGKALYSTADETNLNDDIKNLTPEYVKKHLAYARVPQDEIV